MLSEITLLEDIPELFKEESIIFENVESLAFVIFVPVESASSHFK